MLSLTTSHKNTNKKTLSFKQLLDGIEFKDEEKQLTFKYNYIDLIEQIQTLDKTIPTTFNFDVIKSYNRFFIKNSMYGFFICDLVLNKYIFLSTNKILSQINKLYEKQIMLNKEKQIEKTTRKMKSIYNKIVFSINFARDLFYKEIYAKMTGDKSYKYNCLAVSRGNFDFDEYEVFDKWGIYSKHCIFDEKEMIEEIKNNEEIYPKRIRLDI